MDLVSIEKLDFELFQTPILHNITMNVFPNEFILLIGSNGAGKTTLLRTLAGIHLITKANKFSILGKRSPADQFHGLAFLGNRWVRHVAFSGMSSYTADIAAGEMMAKLQEEYLARRNELVQILNINLNWRMHQVSDGQRKKVQLMLALLKPFRLVLIDEFINELDVVVRDRFFKYLVKECRQRNGSIIYATHVFDNLSEWITHVYYIKKGHLEPKMTLNQFNKSNNLYHSVKNKLLEEPEQNSTIEEKSHQEQQKLYGLQLGYASGRILNTLNKNN